MNEKYIRKLFKNSDIVDYREDEYNNNYNGCNFKIDNKLICYREAKKTPKKAGYFVVLWRKGINGNEPYSERDLIDLYIIDIPNKGFFIFPKTIMIHRSILMNNKSKGKMGFRIYIGDEKLTNEEAMRTETWQMEYYVDNKIWIDMSVKASAML